MANTITPQSTNIAASGRTVTLQSSAEFNVGLPNSANKLPLVNFLADAMAFEQMIDYVVDVAAATDDENIWEATSEALRARAVIIQCEYGGGGIVINPAAAEIPFPLSADETAGNGFMMYANPGGIGLTTGAGATGPGIQKISVSAEVESRFKVYIFV